MKIDVHRSDLQASDFPASVLPAPELLDAAPPVFESHFTEEDLNVLAFRRAFDQTRAGAVLIFEGTVRDHSPAGDGIIALEYEAMRPMADRIVARILAEVRAQFPLEAAAVIHRVGRVPLLLPTVLIGVASAHRNEAFLACRELIDRVKHEAPIWKREIFQDGTGRWSEGCTACSHSSHASHSSNVKDSRQNAHHHSPKVLPA
jgi:molybdopterin synthase catalytic subunit